MAHPHWSIILVLCLCLVCVCDTTKILLLPFPSDSHLQPNIAIGEALLQKGGYDVYMILPSKVAKPRAAHLKSSKIKVLEYQITEKDWQGAFFATGGSEEDTSPEAFFDYVSQTSFLLDLKTRGAGFGNLCIRLLENKEYHRLLKSLNFDHAIVDAHPFSRCYYVLLYKLGIPYSSYMQEYDSWLLRAPALPSFVPSVFMEHSSDHMPMWDRIMNVWTQIHWSFFTTLSTLDNNLVSSYVQDQLPYMSVNQLARRSQVWFSDAEFLLDYPRPIMPNEYLIGGLLTSPAAALPTVLEDFVNPNGTNVKGVIVVHLGNEVILPPRLIRLLVDVLNSLTEYRILWQYKSDMARVTPAPHIKILQWLPINDVLGHKNTKLFITAATSHEQQVALYQGVPMLGIPIEGLQRHNANKAKHRGYGLTIDIHTTNDKDIMGHIKKMLSTEEYEKKANFASAILQGRTEHPRETVNELITLALDDHLQHLHSASMDLPWYQYLLVDVTILIGFILSMALWLLCNTLLLSSQKLRLGFRTRRPVAQATNGIHVVTATPHTIPTLSFKAKQT